MKLYRACGSRTAPHAKLVYDYMGDKFDDSVYQKIRQSLENRVKICEHIGQVYNKKLENIQKANVN